MRFGFRMNTLGFAKKTRRMAAQFAREQVRAFKKAGMILVTQAKRQAPVDRGPMRRSITCVVRQAGHGVHGEVGSNRPEARWTEFGNKPNAPGGMIVPTRKKALAFRVTTGLRVRGRMGRRGRAYKRTTRIRRRVIVRGVHAIRVGTVLAPRKSWPAQRARGGTGQTMPWLRPAYHGVRGAMKKMIRREAGRTLTKLARA